MHIFINFIIVILFLVFSTVASAGVVVFDAVTATKKSVKLKALAKGKLFPEGGRLVEFYVDGKQIGTTLSGGDGYALFEYLPFSSGIKHLKVKAGADTDEGVLLIMGGNDKVLLIEIEGTLSDSPFLFEPLKGSKEAIKKLSRKFKVVYLTTVAGVKESKKWLKDNGFFSSAALKWRGVDSLDELQEHGIKPYALIASPAMVTECKEHIKKRVSFEDTENGVVVKDWNELLNFFK